MLVSSKGNAQATDEHSHVRALSATIGMKFVKYKKLQIGSGLHQFSLVRPGQDQFQHDIVSQENVRWIIKNFLSGLFSFLPGISAESDGEGAACFQKFVQLQFLRIGKGVHGVHNNGFDALSRALFENRINDGNDVGQALA